jgi:four helix bundle protein
MKTFSFEKLKVWQKSLDLSEFIYSLPRDFPDEERFGLTSQMRRASVSIISHISEGSGRHTGKEKARFTEIAYGSVLEIINQAILSVKFGFISEENYEKIRIDSCEITAMTDALYKAQVGKS